MKVLEMTLKDHILYSKQSMANICLYNEKVSLLCTGSTNHIALSQMAVVNVSKHLCAK